MWLATAAIEDGTIQITSVGAGTAAIVVFDASQPPHTATIAVTVAADGTIAIGAIAKYGDGNGFTATTNADTVNDEATLGLTGTTVVSNNAAVATAAVVNGTISVTSVGAGTAVITVSDSSTPPHTATIAVTVAADGTIAIGAITKYESEFTAQVNDTVVNNTATLGLTGTTAASSNTAVATAAVVNGTIQIISVAAGTAVVTVSDSSTPAHTATIAVTVAADGAVAIGTITKYESGFTAQVNDTVINNTATLGLTGTTAASSNTAVATATVVNDTIQIISVAAGTAVVTVSDGSAHTATIPVTVAADGAVAIGIITKYASSGSDYVPVSAGNTFLIYGYNVISSAYINRADVKVGRPILDLNKVNGAELIVQSNATSSRWNSAAGESIVELFRSLNASAKVGYEGVAFSGSVEAEFSLSEDSKNTARYAKGQGFHITRDEYLQNNAPSALADLMSDTFKADIASKSAAQLINDYGTHLMTRVYWGGEAEFNYSYTGTELATTADIKAALNASYGGFSGEAKAELEQKAKELNTYSTFTSSSRGGDNSAFTSKEDFDARYEAWVQSVQNKPDICGIPNFDNDLLPLWDLVAAINPEKAQAIQTEFERIVTAQGAKLAGYVYVPAGSRTYITAIDIQNIAKTNTTVPGGMTNLVRTDMYKPASGGVLGGVLNIERFNVSVLENLQIAYKAAIKAGNNHRNAIAEIALTWGSSEPDIPAGWKKVNYNMGFVLSGTIYMYLIYRPVNENDTRAVDFIGSYQAGNAGTGYIDNDYEWVSLHPNFSAQTRWNLTIMSSSIFTYLTVHYNPFEW